MGKVTIAVGIVAAILFWGLDDIYFWVTVLTTALAFWSFGVMHNFAMDSAKANRTTIIDNKKYDGASNDEIERIRNMPINIKKADLRVVPNWLALANMICSTGVIILFIIAILKRFL
jgi:hypothetical protein